MFSCKTLLKSICFSPQREFYASRGTFGSERFEHIYCRTVTPLRRTDLRPLHRVPNGKQHFPRNRHTFGPRRFRRLRPRHAFQNRIRHRNPELVFHELGIAHADQRPDSGYHGDAAVFDSPQKVFQQTDIENRLRHRVFGSGLHFELEPPNFFVQIGEPGIRPHANHKAGTRTDRDFRPRSSPRFKLWTILTRPMASTSKTAVASG